MSGESEIEQFATVECVRPRRILLVEDDAEAGPGIALLLEMEGFLVHLVTTGAGCAPAVASFRPDVVVLDIGLPDVDGTTVYAGLAQHYPDLPVIISTGHAEGAAFEHMERGERFGFLQKPYPIAALLELIARLT